eukprot:TRINITY_DN6746_c0_g1_i1.p1 TRINITY_DN6746_c0_g1~~TRINITY_DN6746_c0_g1_i1.p1  ORF type:complete len:207 (+),score=14.45 TRINITY_DN6746_c0_g1_i1:207-827(+)
MYIFSLLPLSPLPPPPSHFPPDPSRRIVGSLCTQGLGGIAALGLCLTDASGGHQATLRGLRSAASATADLQIVSWSCFRFVDSTGAKLTSAAVTTWLTDSGIIACSCVGRGAIVARNGEMPAKRSCQHARTIRGAISYLSARLSVRLPTFRRLPRLFGEDANQEVGAHAGAGSELGGKLDWDAESVIEAFRTGQTAVAVVLSGMGV